MQAVGGVAVRPTLHRPSRSPRSRRHRLAPGRPRLKGFFRAGRRIRRTGHIGGSFRWPSSVALMLRRSLGRARRVSTVSARFVETRPPTANYRMRDVLSKLVCLRMSRFDQPVG
jgi:hypothetical protein